MSYIALFQTCLNPAKNAKVDDIHTYLSGLTPTYASADFQYVKLDLDIEIKVDLPQEYQAVSTNVGNYALIQNESTGKQYFFFIMKATWISKSCIKLNLSMDTINTFADDFTFDKKTTIIREHKDRYTNTNKLQPNNTFTFYDKVDLQDEGISGAIKYRTNKNKIEDDRWLQYSNQKWYMVYTTPEVTTSSYPIKVRVVPQTPIPLLVVSQQIHYLTADFFEEGYYYYYTLYDNPSGTWNGTALGSSGTYGARLAVICWRNGSNMEAHWIEETNTSFSSQATASTSLPIALSNSVKMRRGTTRTVNPKNIQTFTEIPVMSGSGIQMSACIDNIDRTLSTTIKIIELPYAPFICKQNTQGVLDLPTGWSIDESFFLTTTINQELEQKITSNPVDLGLNETYTFGSSIFIRRTMRDTKLKHSAFYNFKICYDSYATSIPMEQIDREGYLSPTIDINYHQANTITSNLGFKITYNHCTKKETEDYGEYVIAQRNNESPIYTSAYLDYIRTGYNYDRKNQTRNNITTYIGAGVAIAGAIGAAALSTTGIGAVAAVSIGASAITTLTNAISNTVSSEQAIQQKIDELKAQATSIQSADDINLMNWYNENKVYINEYRVSDELYNLMDDLFYYCGYAVNKQGIPDTTSRVFFNYIQCEPVFVEEFAHTYDAYLEDIKARYAAGVTVYHNVSGAWDFEQNMENWEIKLC